MFCASLPELVLATAAKVANGAFYGALAVVIGTLLLLFGFLTVDVDPKWTKKVNALGTIFLGCGTVYGFGATFNGYGDTKRSIFSVGGLVVVLVVGLCRVRQIRRAKKNTSP